jgi:hypothetical protein
MNTHLVHHSSVYIPSLSLSLYVFVTMFMGSTHLPLHQPSHTTRPTNPNQVLITYPKNSLIQMPMVGWHSNHYFSPIHSFSHFFALRICHLLQCTRPLQQLICHVLWHGLPAIIRLSHNIQYSPPKIYSCKLFFLTLNYTTFCVGCVQFRTRSSALVGVNQLVCSSQVLPFLSSKALNFPPSY